METSDVPALLRETLRMKAALEPGGEIRGESLAHLHRVHEALRSDYTSWVEARLPGGKFQPPPLPGVPGWIVPLDSAEDLVREGRDQSNCVAGYVSRVRENQVFIYKVLRPERATLSLVRSPDGGWEVGQLSASCNQQVARETWDFVEEWVERWSMDGKGSLSDP